MPVLTLITPPAAAVLSLAEAREHLRVTSGAENALIQGLIDAAVAHLDGWPGLLGRAIMQQQWRQDFNGWGDLRLALPDVSAVTVTAVDDNGDALTVTQADLDRDDDGWFVTAAGAGSPKRVSVVMTCAMPAAQLAPVRVAVRQMVAHWFSNREAVGEGGMEELPLSARALIAPLRWRHM